MCDRFHRRRKNKRAHKNIHANRTSELIVQLNEANFDEQVKQNKMPVLVEVKADWCPVCQNTKSIIDDISTQYAGRLMVGQVDVDADEKLAADLGVKALPTIFLYKNGQVIQESVGRISKDKLGQLIDAAFLSETSAQRKISFDDIAKMGANAFTLATSIKNI